MEAIEGKLEQFNNNVQEICDLDFLVHHFKDYVQIRKEKFNNETKKKH